MQTLPVPAWLARAGIFSWLALGVLGFSAVIILGLSTFSTIVLPVIFSAVAAAVFAPLVSQFARWGVPRGLGSLLTIVLIIGGLVAIVAVITRSVINQADQLAAAFTVAFEDLQAWLAELGIDEGFIEQAREAVTSLVTSGGGGGGLVSSAAGVAPARPVLCWDSSWAWCSSSSSCVMHPYCRHGRPRTWTSRRPGSSLRSGRPQCS